MRKRYTRKYRHWSPRWKWKLQDERVITEFERDWQGGYPRVIRRRGQEGLWPRSEPENPSENRKDERLLVR